MAKRKSKYRASTLSSKQSRSFSSTPTREEIAQAVRDYLANGGKITKVEPEWIEEGKLYIIN